MSNHAAFGFDDPRRARIRIQIRTKPGLPDEILIVRAYSIIQLDDGSFVLSYNKNTDSKTERRNFKSGTYFETKLMG